MKKQLIKSRKVEVKHNVELYAGEGSRGNKQCTCHSHNDYGCYNNIYKCK